MVRKLVTDFDLTVLAPLILLAFGVLWNSSRRYLELRSIYKSTLKRIELPFDTREEEDQFLEWGSQRCTAWREARNFLWLPATALVVVLALMFMPDGFKVEIAEGLWMILWVASLVCFVVSIPMAWHYAKELDWWKFGLCLLVALMLAASTEHFFFQSINARHVNCPHCENDDYQPDDN